MRRAAEGATPAAAPDVETLAPEAFPDETADGQRVRVAQPREVPADELVPPASDISAPSRMTFDEEEPPEDRSYARFAKGTFEKIVGDRRMPAVCREQYRRLAAVLHDAQETNRTQVVMVASAVAGEGKTLTAANVALTLSNSYRKRVLVIDADLRRPTMHKIFRLETSSGLTDGLDPAANKPLVVRQVAPRLALLPAGRPITDPMAGLTSPRVRQLIDEARGLFDWIIVDTPPLVLLPDATLLTSLVDAALLVVKAESTPHVMVKRAMENIGRSRLLGVVLNAARVGPHGSYYGYTYGYDYAPIRSEVVSP
jgi:capsular exopolysaccharide synthesis family protein